MKNSTGVQIDEWIGDLAGRVVSGCGNEPIPEGTDLDFVKYQGRWYKIKAGFLVVSKGGGGRMGNKIRVRRNIGAYPVGDPSIVAGRIDGGIPEYLRHIENSRTKKDCGCED